MLQQEELAAIWMSQQGEAQGGDIQNSSIYMYVLPFSERVQPVISHTDAILSLL